MSEPDTKKRLPWGRIALVISLSVNLLIVGLVAGAILRGHADGPPGGEFVDLGFAPYYQALPRAEKAALRAAILRDAGNFRENRAALKRQFDGFLRSLRAEPFDPAALRRLVESQRERVGDRVALGQNLLLERIEAMSPADRAAYADALDRALRRRHR